MYNEVAPEFVVDQGLYYPNATSYGYICTGLEPPGDWDDHHGVFGVDGQDIQFIGTQTESLPYVYYTPSYGYAQSPYNPYNPYIPGAMMGADGSFVGAQQYYLPSYDNGATSPAYFPMLVQSGPDTFASSMTDQFVDTAASTARADASSFKRNLSTPSSTVISDPVRVSSNHAHGFARVSEGFRSNGGPAKLPGTNGGMNFNKFSVPAPSQVLQGQGAQATDNLSNGKALSTRNQLKVSLPSGNGLYNFGSSDNGRAIVDKVRAKLPFGGTANDVDGNPDTLVEQNRGPRTNKSKTQLTVKAYTKRAGNSDAQGNIIIHTDQYNKDDFPVDYVNAKFYVIKSYSEDDVHKSIKYNVWSSTPNGNNKLNIAYEDAQKIAALDPRGCPVFLFFSVNASGQFCGVAEMVGHVDFHKDMDFWQQDKWSGSFPVKWHIVKDVPNPNFRHIILENNEHKPVTNSRDTQEIKYKKGIEMLKVFKNYVSKTSLLDDFMYYENRQKMLQEEKARLLIKSYGTPVFVPVLDPPRKLNGFFHMHSTGDDKIDKSDGSDPSNKNVAAATSKPRKLGVDACNSANDDRKQVVDGNTTEIDALKIGSLTISPKLAESKPFESSDSANVLTVGSMPVKVDGILTVGTIPLDPKALKMEKSIATNLTKTKPQKG